MNKSQRQLVHIIRGKVSTQRMEEIGQIEKERKKEVRKKIIYNVNL